jgi:GT2 family glycosyltransferase
MSKVGLILVSWNNNQYLVPCVNSIMNFADKDMALYIVNNGEPENMRWVPKDDRITVIQNPKNLGWEGGIKAGLAVSKEEFVVLMNDDTFIPMISKNWINDLLAYFKDPKVGAVGPSSNYVMGAQQIFSPLPPEDQVLRLKFLINFCCMVRRSALDEAGGIDDTLPGGDDLDQSLRLRQKGFELLVDRSVFVYHHGAKTGERINGGSGQSGGWNSMEMTEKTNFSLIRKHGLRSWMDMMTDQIIGTYEFQQA